MKESKEQVIRAVEYIIKRNELKSFDISTPAVIDFVKNGQTYMKQGDDIYITIHLLRR